MKRWRGWLTLTLLTLTVFSSNVFANTLKGIRVWPSPDETRVVLDLASTPEYHSFQLTKSNRVVVELSNTVSKITLPIPVNDSGILTQIRSSKAGKKGGYRLVFEVKDSVKPKVFALKPTVGGRYGHRLVIDLPHKERKPLPIQPIIASTKATSEKLDDIVVAIDAGHGGEDPGSIGPGNRYEKHVTLAIAKQLAIKIDATPGMKAVLVRSGDYFVSLNKRSEIARKNKAMLLVSIHADGFHSPRPRGASVWVLNTSRANSEIGRWLEDQEKQSELLGGGDVLSGHPKGDQYLSMAVLDLQFSHSQREAYDVAQRVLGHLKKVAVLHKQRPEHASFAVLKSPDIPSLLVETGFITNPIEARLLTQRGHQKVLTNAIYRGVLEYFDAKPPEGTLFASLKKGINYKVKSGDALSVIANRYGISVDRLQKANNLKSTSLRIGQILKIPVTTDQYLENAMKKNEAKSISSSAVVSKAKMTSKTVVVTHKVKRGEFLGKIADQHNVTVDSIRSRNKLRSDSLAVGQTLKIQKTIQVPKRVTYRVKSGDFLSKIAGRYGVTVDSIRRLNKLSSDKIAVGQTLIIPSS